MIHQATKKIYDAMEAKGLKASIQEIDESSVVNVGFSLDNGAPIQIRFVSMDEDNDVGMYVAELVHVEADKAKNLLPVLNRFNTKYRYVKFALDRDNDINVKYDLPLSNDEVGECALEMVARFVQIIREVYPELMRTLWN